MRKVVFKNGKVVSATGEFSSGNIIADLKGNNDIITKTDNNTNIKLEASTNIIPDDTVLKIEEITSGTTYDNIKNNLSGINQFKVFDITLKVNDTVVQPNGKVKVYIPIPTGFDASKLIVYRVEDNGNKTECPVTVANGYASFETDHFSVYILGEKTEANNDNKLPQTGEEPNLFAEWLSIVIVLGIFWLTSMLLIEREKKRMLK